MTERVDHDVVVIGAGFAGLYQLIRLRELGYDVRVLGRIPLDPSLREGGDAGKPIVESDPTTPAAQQLLAIAQGLTGRGRGLAGMQLGLTPTAKF